jgi:hypothetical protein
MVQIVVKMLNKHYPSDKDISNVINYIAGNGKNRGKEQILKCRGLGVSQDMNEATQQMIAVQRAYGKDNKRRLYHLIVSYPPDKVGESTLINTAEAIAYFLFEDYQVFYGIHVSKKHKHIHFAINAVSYRTGNKFHQNAQEYKQFKEDLTAIININGYFCLFDKTKIIFKHK